MNTPKLEVLESSHVIKALTAITGGPMQSQQGVIAPPALPPLAIDFVPVVNVGEGSALVMRGMPTPYPAAVDPTAPGTDKPELATVVFEQDEADFETFAAWVKASKQILADAPALLPFLETILSRSVRLGIDKYIMAFLTNAAVAGTGGANNVAAAVAQLYTTKGVIADTVAFDPVAYFALAATDPFALPAKFMGLNVGLSAALPANAFVVGPFAGGSVLAIRDAMNVAIGMVDDDFTRNLRTVLGEARGAWSSLDNDAFLRGSIV